MFALVNHCIGIDSVKVNLPNDRNRMVLKSEKCVLRVNYNTKKQVSSKLNE